jgi:restriction modification system DNA specificity domain protein
MKYRSTPYLRFNKFKEKWQLKVLGDLGSVAMNKRIFREETSEVGEIPFYKIGTFGSEPDSFITREKFEEYKSKYPYPEIGDILISASGSIGRTVEYKGEEAYFQDSNIVWLKHDEQLDNSFLKQFYSIVKWQGIEGTTIKRLYNKNILETPIALPSISEQSAIGSLFRTLDDLLASYKNNLANYQSLKATMLSKMFPKAGQTVPEIRLEGFEGEWKVVQLSDICQKVTEKNKDNSFNETFTNSAEFGIISQRDFFEKDISNEKSLNTYYVVRNNDFVYNPRISNYAPVGPVKRNKLGRTGVMSPLYFVFRIANSNIDLNFLETFFNTNTWHKFMKLNGDSGARADRFAIKDSTFLTMPITFPSLPEQQAIGAYFSNLDNLINSHQEKISQLETLKKKLLQDMFI